MRGPIRQHPPYGASWRPGTRAALGLLVLLPLVSACQTAMSLEAAQKVTASFSGAAFVPPPRTINDIAAILDQEKRAHPGAAQTARIVADQEPPRVVDRASLASFYFHRGLAAREIGRVRQEVDDLTRAASYAGSAPMVLELQILFQLSIAENRTGNFTRGVAYAREAIRKVRPDLRGWLISLNSSLAVRLALFGDLDAAEAALKACLAAHAELAGRPEVEPVWLARWEAYVAQAQGTVAAAKGGDAEAEAFYRRAIEALERDRTPYSETWLDERILSLAVVLARQGRLLEAENEARRALLGALRKRGRYSPHTALILGGLVNVLSRQGRHGEAETLARAAVDMYETTDVASDSHLLARARADLAAILVGQGRWREALAEYEGIRAGLGTDPQGFEQFRRSFVGLAGAVGWAAALLKNGRLNEALEMLTVAHERSARTVGEGHRSTAEIRALLAMVHAARGDRLRALREFAEATPLLLGGARDVDDESLSRPAQDQRTTFVLEAYMVLLAEVRGTPLEREAGVDAATAAFRLAEAARGRSVQRALDASAARVAARTPALAELVRGEQDARKQLAALYGALANALSQPTQQQDAALVAKLRAQADRLREARKTLTERIAKEFPAYAQLVDPPPVTLERGQASLRPGEALISTYVAPDGTFVWAIPHRGPVAFAVAPLGAEALAVEVAALRWALDPGARTVGDIQEFDVTRAHRLYETLLAPVAPGWREAESLLVVPHGALAQIPLTLLVTRPTVLGPERDELFARYRAVPWLVRRHAVTVLPSVNALVTLRGLPPGRSGRRPFVGFGDPYFSPEHLQAARRERGPLETAALAPRSAPLTLRDLRVQSLDSARLAILPRLPDTAAEIRGIAQALNADLSTDVFLGERANEKTVKTLDLAAYRVVAFATHGLVPGDLDGLTQPALALTAAEVANVEGDGLLTMEEILALRLNADWVVLSACNTASGRGAGAEAISGLGRAFFYAGARALLVSNWPVETTSARALTTDLFRRQQAYDRLTRARALQQTMNTLIDGGRFVDPRTRQVVFSYAHPIFWAPFTLVGEGGHAAP